MRPRPRCPHGMVGRVSLACTRFNAGPSPRDYALSCPRPCLQRAAHGAARGTVTSVVIHASQQRGGCVAEDTIITWSDAELQTDIALSFQEAAGCNHVWEQIQNVHQRGDVGRRRGACCGQPCCRVPLWEPCTRIGPRSNWHVVLPLSKHRPSPYCSLCGWHSPHVGRCRRYRARIRRRMPPTACVACCAQRV